MHAEFNANAYSGRVEGGYRYVTPWMGVTPYAAGQFTTYSLPAYAEQVLAGAGTFALNYAAKDVTDPRTELGVRTDRSFAMPNGILTLRGRLAWAHDYKTDRNVSAVFQTLPGAAFVVNGAAQAHDFGADHGLRRNEMAERLVGRGDLRGRVLRRQQFLCRQGRRALHVVAACGREESPTVSREETMRAAIFRDGEIVVDTLPEPEPGAGEVLVKTLACGICGSDLHARKHAHRMVELTSIFPAASRWTFPATSCSATSSAASPGPWAGDGAQAESRHAGLFAAGIADANRPQGIGYSNDNIGGYAERMLLSEALLLEVPNGLAAEHAALTEPLAVGVHAVAKAGIAGNEVPLVIGCGPVGLAVIAALKIKGLHPIIAADYSPARRALAEKIGADVVVDPARTQPYASWAEHAAMSPEEKAARPPLQALLPALKPALIFECVGVPGLIAAGLRGRAARRPHRRGRRLHGNRPLRADARHRQGTERPICARLHAGRIRRSLRLIAEGKVDAASLVPLRVGIDGVAQAFDDLANPERIQDHRRAVAVDCHCANRRPSNNRRPGEGQNHNH